MRGDFICAEQYVERAKICALEIWVECFGNKAEYIQRKDTVEINNILEGLENWEKSKKAIRFGPYGVQKGFIKK